MVNYEEKYKNALSQAKQAINNIPDKSLAKWLQSIFPELQESDDEKMRTWLIEYFDKVNDEISKEDRQKIITYLEKQGEQKPEELPNGEDYGIDSLYHAERILEKTLGEVDGYQSDDGILEHKCAIEAVKRLYKQKPIWSEEDEELRLQCIDVMEHFPNPNQKVAWSACIKWLKSLKERYTWKPSDEQMKALSYAGNSFRPFEEGHKILWSLYNDLKKLREE